MFSLQLYIDNQEIELFDDEPITIKQTIQDIRDIGKIFTDFTKDFSVPASPENNKVFKHFYDATVEGFDASVKQNAELHLNYQLYKKGKVVLNSASIKNRKPVSYNLTFFGSTVNIKDYFGEDKLDGLNTLDQIYFEYTADNVIEYLKNGMDFILSDDYIPKALVFPLISHTDRLFYDSGSENAGDANLFPSTSIKQGVDFQQLKPAIRVYSIIKAIEDHYTTTNGYPSNIVFSRDFFSKENLEFFDLYIWLHKKKGVLFEESVGHVEFYGTEGDTDEFGMDESYWQTKYFNIYDYGSKVEFFLDLKVTSGVDDFNVVLYKGGEEYRRYDNLQSGLNHLEDFSDTDNAELLPPGGYNIKVESQNVGTFRFELGVKKTRPNKFLGLFTRTFVVTFDGFVQIGANKNIYADDHLPDIKVYDFLVGIFKMFNLTAFVKNDDTIVVKTLDDFYESSENTWNISEYIDESTATIESVNKYSSIDFKYEGTGSFLAENHKEIANKEWGQLIYKGENLGTTKDRAGEKYNIKLPFEHFKYERLIDADDNNQTGIQVGYSIDKEQNAYLGKPLLFYPIQRTNSTEISVLKTSTVSEEITTYHIPSNSRQLIDTENINFSAELNEYTGVPFVNGLFKKHYQAYIKDVFNKNRRMLKIKANLPVRILSKMQLNDKIIIFNNLYKINTITTNYETLVSKLELINELTDFRVQENQGDLARTVDKPFITVDNPSVTADTGTIS
jgi:hypothetical protein